MHFHSLLLVLLAGVAPAVATSNTTEPCGIITSQLTKFYENKSNNGLSYKFDPELANACLLSSTIDSELAAMYIRELKKYAEFQSDLSYLKAPPADYPYPPVDLLGSLDALVNTVESKGFESQYVLDQALSQLYTSAHEGHLYTSFCTASAIQYGRTFSLVSVSPDGIALPELYVLTDLESSPNTMASSVIEINGQDANTFIEQEALYQTSDPDASYNWMMFGLSKIFFKGAPIGALTSPNVNFYPGQWTNITFSNGTNISSRNIAIISAGSWSDTIIDGESFTNHFCIQPAKPQPSSTSSPSSSASAVASATAAATEFPNLFPYPAVVRDPNNQAAGFYLNGSQYDDTSVLWIGTFEQENAEFADQSTIAESLQNTTRDFLAVLRTSNKTKLIIDMSGNPGGNSVMPDDFFKRLFPTIEPYGASRLRVGEAANIIGSTLAAIPDNQIYPTEAELDAQNLTLANKLTALISPYDYRSSLTTGLMNFTTWNGSYFPPITNNGDIFTANFRSPLNDSLYTQSIDGIDVYGYASNPAIYPQPFPVEDIVILTDGFCASACSIFVELLTRQAHVKTIAVGGRPRPGPIQAIGGTKGSLAYPYTSIQAQSQIVLNNTQYVPSSLLSQINDTLPGLVPLPLGSPGALSSFGVNLQDNIPEGDEGQVPLQFVFEPADCRIFYTKETVLGQNRLWEYASEVAWKGKKCAWGALNGNVTTGGNETTPPPPVFTGTASGLIETSALVFIAVVGMLCLL